MDYFCNITYITLTGHVELERYRSVYFVVTLTVFLLIIFFNVSVIFVIFTNQCLHEPMYMFIVALLFNALFGTAALYPKLLIDLLSETQVASYIGCTIQSYLIVTYGASEFALLSAMAYDRYVSICKPLQYATILKIPTVKKIIVFCWCLPSCETGIGLILTYQYKPCRFHLNRIYCNTASVVRLSCDDISVKTTYGQALFIIAIVPPVAFICYSYYRILKVCLKGSKESTKKFLQTCVPHILVVISFTSCSCFEFICNRMEMNIPHTVSMIMSVENLVITPLANPIIYGLKLPMIFNTIKNIILKKKGEYLQT